MKGFISYAKDGMTFATENKIISIVGKKINVSKPPELISAMIEYSTDKLPKDKKVNNRLWKEVSKA